MSTSTFKREFVMLILRVRYMKKSENKENHEGWEGFDDCPICQAMQNGTEGTINFRQQGLVSQYALRKRLQE